MAGPSGATRGTTTGSSRAGRYRSSGAAKTRATPTERDTSPRRRACGAPAEHPRREDARTGRGRLGRDGRGSRGDRDGTAGRPPPPEGSFGSPSGNDARVSYLVLLGDSVFDNAAYVAAGAPDVVRQVRQRLPQGWGATLAAVDGSTTGACANSSGICPRTRLSPGPQRRRQRRAPQSGEEVAAPAASAGEALPGLTDVGEASERAATSRC